eukprot:CAMPEP_0196761162 /NCGR_PEP_ID=MMETSP1095-20130614/311_1 /TAXON_ID=96789 ORGANISM="Chromulina nebulosa, Strain UTEXLB2642" /NCGR_SAMPLE_ID=MMETSP1095 /ASSEMBLY_ACC=CAM_ASM_000446 /LENGTH=199 /DNA_ID=CAMNT_0042110345 /DNA_START=170 /DNA_END=769 /DNA_ORIENTATION=+
MAVELPPLPYDYTALEPYIGEQTLRIHHDKHHAKYVTTTNALIAGTELESADIETIVRASYGKNQGLFNNAAQSYNHAFYWDSIKPNGGGKPTGKLAALIDRDFGSFDKFKAELTNAALTAFGSGWAWLVWTPSGLKVTKTIGADNPLTDAGHIPILTIDVWEHAYYLNYQNLRNTYVETVIDKLINWEFAEKQLPANA